MVGAGLIAVEAANAGTVPAGSVPADAAAATSDSPVPVPSVTGSMPNTSPFPPAAPTNLVVTGLLSHSITLSWTASTPGCCPITAYFISMAQPFTDVFGGTRVGNVTTATVPVSPNGQYTISVRAEDDLGHSSAGSNAITLVVPANDTGDMTAPSTPTNLTFTGTPTSTLTWSPSTDNVAVAGYNVYHFDGWYTSTFVGTATGTTFTVPPSTTPPPPGPYSEYYVRAIDAAGNMSIATNPVYGFPGSPSPSPSASPPSSPPACTVTYTNASQWPGGFVARVKAVNSASTSIHGWKLAFTFGGDQRITSARDATLSQSGAAVTLGNTHGNAVIAAHGSVSVEIRGTWHSSNAAPSAFTLNGVQCGAG
jgi:hypothetical protein